MRVRTLSLALLGSCLTIGCVAAFLTACVDAGAVMQDYLDRSQDLRDEYKPAASDASAAADAGSFSGKYFVACLSPLLKFKEKTLRFGASVEFTATGTGSGPITMQLQPLLVGATTIAHSRAPPFPTAPGATGDVVAGKFTLAFGASPDLPATTNPRSENPETDPPWGINDLVFQATFTSPPDEFCANLGGKTRPSGLPAAGTVCLFHRVANDSEEYDVPDVPAYTCPQ